ncbi:MAG TPA: putative Ig domain-containing protein, partial [Flavisolibacter sp.]|nr:putative Ig domain-containing protein [Flavisolibacter sp.]
GSGYGGGIYNSVATVKAIFANLVIRNNKANIYGAGIYNVGVAVFNNLLVDNNVVNGGSYMYGGGVYNTGAAASYNKVTFQNNAAAIGGGMFNSGSGVSLKEVKFLNNTTTAYAAGLYTNTDITVSNSLFEGNKATTYGGGIANVGGTTTLTDVVFKDNQATTHSGGLYNTANIILNRVSFIANSAVQHGGGMYTTGTATLDNVIFSRNKVSSTGAHYGGGMYATGNSNLTNVTFSNNSIGRADAGGAGFYRSAGVITIFNSIFWGNTRAGNISDQLNAGVNISHSTVQDDYATGSFISVGNPLFVNAEVDNLHLKNGSPAIDKGYTSKTTTTKDRDNFDRIVNGEVDHGAYENQGGETINITPANLTSINRGAALNIQMQGSGGNAPYTWSVLSGVLPTGVTLNPTTGQISGRPMFSGSYTFVIAVTDGQLLGSKQYTLQVDAAATRLYVRAAATTGRNDGTDWSNGFTDLQTALAQALLGDEIWVARGSYSPGSLMTSSYSLVSGVKIYGGFAGTETDLSQRVAAANGLFTVNESILTGNSINRHIIWNKTALANTTFLDGFTLMKAKASEGTSDTEAYRGGAIYNESATANAQFSNLWIKDNIAGTGAGIWNAAPATFNNLIIENNAATYGGAVTNSSTAVFNKVSFINNNSVQYGGAMYNTGASTLSNVIFKGNKATTYGGAIYNTAAPILTDVTFMDNGATTTGGGIHNTGSPTLNRVSFINNTSVQHGAGLYNTGSPKLDNVIFSRNKITGATTSGYGAGMYHYSGTSTLTNTTFSNNSTAYVHATTVTGGGLFYRASGSVSVYNSIFWGNTRGGGVADQIGGTITIASSIVQDGYAGTNILIGDPNFVNANEDNLHLKSGSPAVDAGDNSKTTTTKDLANKDRLVNNIVDLGAYESQGGESLIISPSNINAQNRGELQSIQLTATGGEGSLQWKVSSGSLPAGLTLSASGSLSGRPMIAGTYTFVISADDGTLIGSKQYTLQINPASARLYTNAAAIAGKNDGSNWGNGFTDLQTAFAQAFNGDEIWVAKGNYSPGLLNTSYFTLKEGVKIYGGFAGTEESLAVRDTSKIHTDNISVLDGSKGTASYHVVYNTAALTNATVLDGFVISGGATASSGGVNPGANYYGGGIYNTAGSAIFSNLWIKENSAVYGGGMYNTGFPQLTKIRFIDNIAYNVRFARGAGLYSNTGTIALDEVRFERNKVLYTNSTYADNWGAGMLNDANGKAELNKVTFVDNEVLNTSACGGGGLFASGAVTLNEVVFLGNKAAYGAGICLYSGKLTLSDGFFKENKATGQGGAIYVRTGADPSQMDRVYFIANTAALPGGALYAASTLKLDNAVFSRNSVTTTGANYGGAVHIAGGISTISNAAFSNNSIAFTHATTIGGGALYRSAGTANVYNSIFWGNTRGGGLSDQIGGTVTVNSSIVQDGYATGTNILIGNPLFVNAGVDNLRLQSGSPAIDAGDNSKSTTTRDLSKDLRIVNDFIDLGPYESQSGSSLSNSPTALPAQNRGSDVNIQFTASGGGTDLNWTISSGALPAGLKLSPTGLLSGRPMLVGSYTFVVAVSDGTLVGSKQFTVQIAAEKARIYV